ncbi:RuBisCO operon transcriptional regulator [Geminocystis sp. NIES-3708]|uniref:LysR family transcriptional regulator n=1 Tax=Geminocystis sp. NIES-3708 TaxID=1615909 RepID=UPI0005FC3F74|nr:LysR family transcriptional regulator [Geminocystis sp. NIES-3708]BAQ59974.1 RuBisCO operon transcriptional regulator [Geminocystis sp. NIES-3708]
MIQATLHQLKVFETTARLGSFTKAAEELEITQPTVSSQVKQLTKTIGLPLFEQIGKQLYLTEAGKELLTTCQDVFTQLDNFEMKIADFKGTKEGKLSLSVITTATYFIPRILGSFCLLYPDIDIALQVTNHKQIQERMLNNQDDLYILSQPPEEIDLKSQSFIDNPLVVIAKKDHPLANQKQIPLETLEAYPFIMRESGSGTRKAVQNLFNQHNVNVKVRLELGSNEAIKQAILGGLGISVLSKHTLTFACHEDLTILDIQNFPIAKHWYISHLAGKQLSIIAKTFLEFLIDRTQLMKV